MTKKLDTSKKISKKIVSLMLEKKATNISIIHVDKLTALTDIFIICSSDSKPQTRAISNNIIDGLKEFKIRPLHIEGYQYLKWVLIDYVGITVNIFDKESREYYGIERLWGDAKIEIIKKSVPK